MTADRENSRYLPGAKFPPNLSTTASMEDCVEGARDILISVPSHALRETLNRLKPLLLGEERVIDTPRSESGKGRFSRTNAAATRFAA